MTRKGSNPAPTYPKPAPPPNPPAVQFRESKERANVKNLPEVLPATPPAPVAPTRSFTSRDKFEAWVQTTNVWKKYRNTNKACSLRQTVTGDYCDYRINDRWLAWCAALKH